jgi:Fe-S oxidoreductase
MAIIQDMKSYMNYAGPIVMQNGLAAEDEIERPLVGEFIKDESLWACRTCGACVTECPVLIEHIPSIVDMRRYLVMDQGRVTPTAQQALQNIEQRGHPWRGTPHTRETWIEQLASQGVEVPRYTGREEYLYWVGCSGALVDRNIPITQAVARLLMEAGVSFGVLGQEETCNGDPARRLGNEYLYQMMTEQVISAFNENDVQKVITSCPHCFNTFKNEYPDFGGRYEVIHHADFLQQLLEESRLEPKDAAAIGEKITVHDSCYLGRHNGIYESPREVVSFIPSVDLVEMPRNKRTGLCCGAGGGNMWQEEVGARRVNHVRAEEAVSTGAGIVATACPFCIQMFEDGIPAVHPEEEGRMQAMDIAEVLAMSVRPLEAARPEEAAPA